MKTNEELIEALEKHTHLTYTEYDEEDNSTDYLRTLSSLVDSLESKKAEYEHKQKQIVKMIKDGKIEAMPFVVEGEAKLEGCRIGNVVFLGNGQLSIMNCYFGELINKDEDGEEFTTENDDPTYSNWGKY